MTYEQRSCIKAAMNSLQSALDLDDVTTILVNPVSPEPVAPDAASIILADAVPAAIADAVPAPSEPDTYMDAVANPSEFTYSVPAIPMPEG